MPALGPTVYRDGTVLHFSCVDDEFVSFVFTDPNGNLMAGRVEREPLDDN